MEFTFPYRLNLKITFVIIFVFTGTCVKSIHATFEGKICRHYRIIKILRRYQACHVTISLKFSPWICGWPTNDRNGYSEFDFLIKGRCNYGIDIFQIQQPNYFFIRSKNNNKNRWEMGLLSLSNLEICIKKQNSLVLKLKTWFQRWDSIQISI